jgi:hypothetical protein
MPQKTTWPEERFKGVVPAFLRVCNVPQASRVWVIGSVPLFLVLPLTHFDLTHDTRTVWTSVFHSLMGKLSYLT